MVDFKRCTKCHETKETARDFYLCGDKWRSECRKCTIKRNVIYQRKINSWRSRFGSDEIRKSYMRDYYSKNKEKFAKYRAEFRERFPNYYKEYFKNRDLKKDG